MRSSVAGILWLSLLAGPPAAGQGQECLAGVKMPAVGQWAEYQGVMHQKPHKARYAVVGAEDRDGKRMKWLELRITGEKEDQAMVYQVLTAGTPAEMDQVEEVVYKPGQKPATRLNAVMVKMMRAQLGKNSVLGNLCEGVSLVGKESVTVPAGTFKVLRYHNAKYDSDTWADPDHPFFMIKSVGKDFELSLASSGDGAQSSITETPQEMPGFGPTK